MNDIPDDHPRAQSLRFREAIEAHRGGIVAETGPIAHGRGEAFDYLLGEQTPVPVFSDIDKAAALLLEARNPVISINGNVAVLVPDDIISLSQALDAPLEINVFYGRTQEREQLIADYLVAKGASNVLGVNPAAKVPFLESSRGQVDADGIAKADVVVVPLEDGDRTAALIQWGKKVVSIDLNPFSRSALDSTINICDNIVRAIPLLQLSVKRLRSDREARKKLVNDIDSSASLARLLEYIKQRLDSVSEEALSSR